MPGVWRGSQDDAVSYPKRWSVSLFQHWWGMHRATDLPDPGPVGGARRWQKKTLVAINEDQHEHRKYLATVEPAP